MYFKCDGLDLADAIGKVLKATSTKTTSPILEGIKIDAKSDTLTLSATDLEISIKKSIRAEVSEEGTIVVPGKFFAEYIRKLTDTQLTCSITANNQLKISYNDSQGYIQLLDVLEFPFINDVDTTNGIVIQSNILKGLITKTIFAVAQDDSRPILKGELLEIDGNTIKAVALDGYRLAIATATIEGKSSIKVIVPARSLIEVSKLLIDNTNVVIHISKNYIKFNLVDSVLTSRLIEGEFINYKQIIHNQFSTTVTINREELASAIDRASLLSKIDRNNLVKLDIKENTLTLTSTSEIGNITENLNIGLKGDDLIIAFNSRYFSDCLRATTDDTLKLNFTNNINPCIITPDTTSEYLYLILPVRMQN